MLFILSLIYSIPITNASCPIALRLHKHEEYRIDVPQFFPVSFANWEDDIKVEIRSSKTYGPYTNKNKVFGINFEEYNATIAITTERSNSTIVLGCSTKNEKLSHPGGYAEPVGSYFGNASNPRYPILFSDEKEPEKALYIYIAAMPLSIIIIVFILICKKDIDFDDVFDMPGCCCFASIASRL